MVYDVKKNNRRLYNSEWIWISHNLSAKNFEIFRHYLEVYLLMVNKFKGVVLQFGTCLSETTGSGLRQSQTDDVSIPDCHILSR